MDDRRDLGVVRDSSETLNNMRRDAEHRELVAGPSARLGRQPLPVLRRRREKPGFSEEGWGQTSTPYLRRMTGRGRRRLYLGRPTSLHRSHGLGRTRWGLGLLRGTERRGEAEEPAGTYSLQFIAPGRVSPGAQQK